MIDLDLLIQEALILQDWGFPSFPVNRHKKPVVRWLHLRYTRHSDKATQRYFQRDGVAGIGVVTGPAAGGLVHRDFDDERSYHRWRTRYPSLAERCPTFRTGRGFHVCGLTDSPGYRKLPDGELIASSNRFVVMPPSLHWSGKHYEWINGHPTGIGSYPHIDPYEAGFLNCYRPGKETEVQRQKDNPAEGEVKRILICPTNTAQKDVRESVLGCAATGPGERNHCLFRLARALRDFYPADESEESLTPWLRLWWYVSKSAVRTKEYVTSVNEFWAAWNLVKYPLSQSRPRRIMFSAAQRGRTPAERIWLACVALSTSLSGPFALSARVAAEVGQTSRNTAHRVLTHLVRSGRLSVVERGIPSATLRRATYFRLA